MVFEWTRAVIFIDFCHSLKHHTRLNLSNGCATCITNSVLFLFKIKVDVILVSAYLLPAQLVNTRTSSLICLGSMGLLVCLLHDSLK